MKKIYGFIVSVITAVSVIGGASVNAQAKAEEWKGFGVADLVTEAKLVMDGEISSSSIPVRIENDVMRIWVDKSWKTGELTYEVERMMYGRFDPNPEQISEQDIRNALMKALI